MFSNRNDQSQILCERNEFRRHYEAEFLGLPANQSLCSTALVVRMGYIHEWLIVDLEFLTTFFYCAAHCMFHVESSGGSSRKSLIESLRTVLSIMFRSTKSALRGS